KSIMIGYLRKKDLSSQIIHIWH
ncbi:TPA: XRE family transcriptional regulator, partial [Streptococcus pneumoniae]|nr:XRE family transcriptional regulator [Streptococcus pneumoniae]